jgi:hypothetical protein
MELYKEAMKNPRIKQEYQNIKNLLEEGIHPVNIGKNSAFVSSTKVLIKKGEARYIVDVSETTAEIVGVNSRKDARYIKKFESLMNIISNLDLKGY